MSSKSSQEVSPPQATPKVLYKECLRNHQGTCMKFLTTAEANTLETVWCICGCHARDHRLVQESPPPPTNTSYSSMVAAASTVHPPPPPAQSQPIANNHHAGHSPDIVSGVVEVVEMEGNIGAGERQRRPKTKFTAIQKEKLREYAEKVGWAVQKKDKEGRIRFCEEIGIATRSCKNWITNNRKLIIREPSKNRKQLKGEPSTDEKQLNGEPSTNEKQLNIIESSTNEEKLDNNNSEPSTKLCL